MTSNVLHSPKQGRAMVLVSYQNQARMYYSEKMLIISALKITCLVCTMNSNLLRNKGPKMSSGM